MGPKHHNPNIQPPAPEDISTQSPWVLPAPRAEISTCGYPTLQYAMLDVMGLPLVVPHLSLTLGSHAVRSLSTSTSIPTIPSAHVGPERAHIHMHGMWAFMDSTYAAYVEPMGLYGWMDGYVARANRLQMLTYCRFWAYCKRCPGKISPKEFIGHELIRKGATRAYMGPYDHEPVHGMGLDGPT